MDSSPLTDDRWCFACGSENPHGLRTCWSLDADGVARARFQPERHHQGWRGVVHGGILATLLDEAMAQRVRLAGPAGAVTAGLSIRFRHPAPTSGTLVIEARMISEDRRAIKLEASVRAEDGTCYAEAEGFCIRRRKSIQ